MLKNNNQKAVDRLAMRSIKNNGRRSATMFLAVMLAAFMLFTVLTVGITYFKMYRLQNIRLSGAEFDAIMYGMTEEQKERCGQDEDIVKMGIAAVAGSVPSTDYDDTVNIGCIWADKVYWEEMMEPARNWVKGKYPEKENEVMVTEKALETCGVPDLTIGDSFRVKYVDGRGETFTKELTISGIWDGYGATNVLYVSEAFYEKCGYSLSDVASGRIYFDFKQLFWTEEDKAELIEEMELEKQQILLFSVMAGEAVPVFFGICALAAVTCLCACLLVYNILYLSVAGNIRYYGLLQTIGMTQRQVRSLMKRQMLFIGGGGIAAGVILGCGAAFLVIPSVIRGLGIHAGEVGAIEISFHPAVFFLTVLLTALTIAAGGRKPVQTAASVSPVEAVRYRPGKGKAGRKRTGQGNVLFRMAAHQIAKDKKRSAVIMVSLAAGMSVFLCMVTLLESQGARTFVSSYMDTDMTITNDTLKTEDHDKWEQIIDESFLSEIEKTEGVQDLHRVVTAEITVPWEPDFADLWMEEFYAKWMNEKYESDVEEYKEYPENFGSFLVGIDKTDFEYLVSLLDTPVDEQEFLDGKTCIIYRNGLDFKTSDIAGKEVTVAEYGNGENTRTFEIAGMTDESYYTGQLLGMPPAVIVSDSVAEEFSERSFVSKVSVLYEKEYDREAEAGLCALMENSPHRKDFSYTSKIQEAENVKAAQGNMMEIGMGAAVILALIGILNYINTITGNIQSRQLELSVMESIGMTERQMRRMLVLEGLLFGGGSLLLTATAGMAVTYIVYESMNYMGADFAVPVPPVLAMALFILAVCVAIPDAARRLMTGRGSVAERIKGVE